MKQGNAERFQRIRPAHSTGLDAARALLARVPDALDADIIWGSERDLPFCSDAARFYAHWLQVLETRGGQIPRWRDIEGPDLEDLMPKLRLSKLEDDDRVTLIMLGDAADMTGGQLPKAENPAELFTPRAIELSRLSHHLVQREGACLLTRYSLQMDDGRLVDIEGILLPIIMENHVAVIGVTNIVGSSHQSAPLRVKEGKIDMVGQLAARVLWDAHAALKNVA